MLPEPVSFLQPVELPILSVTDLSLSLKQLVEGHFRRVRVRGEISGFKRHTSGHAYFTLKDQDSIIDAVAWRGTNLKAPLQDGLEVVVTGRLTIYPGRSKYQIVVDGAEAAGEGALLKVLLERKARLQAEGLFERKRALPAFPKTIGVITSATGAVIQDILHRLSDRYPCHVLVWPVLVQGPGAADQITAAIHGFNALDQKPNLLIVARGGGSLEDLWCFNEENVVRAAAASQIPLISAVGHETDTTLIDWASDLRAPTPTAAAELATPVLSQVRYTIQQYSQRLYNLVDRQFTTDSLHLTNLARALPSPQQVVEQTMLRVDDWGDRLVQAYGVLLNYKQQSLAFQRTRLRAPLPLLESGNQKVGQLVDRLTYSQHQLMNQLRDRLTLQSTCLEQNSYQRILKRGFSLITVGDHVVSSVDYFHQNPRASVDLHFADGVINIETNVSNLGVRDQTEKPGK